MTFHNKPYKVYVTTDNNGFITAVDSSAFLTDLTNWIEIDSGYGDKYHHAQGNYFPQLIRTDGGEWRYKLLDGIPVGCSAEEIAEQESPANSMTALSLETRVDNLEAATFDLNEALTMILEGTTE